VSAGEARQLRRQLEREGFLVLSTGSGHWEVRLSRDGEKITSFGNSPGGGNRWKQNTLAQLRRWKRAHGWQPRSGRALQGKGNHSMHYLAAGASVSTSGLTVPILIAFIVGLLVGLVVRGKF
jgi:hypothetical protein